MLQVQLEDDGGGGSRQSWMESSDMCIINFYLLTYFYLSGLWLMIQWEQQGISQVTLSRCNMLSGRSCSVDDDRENIDRLHASSEQHKRQLRSNQLDVRKSEQKIKDLTINIRC